MVADKKVLLAFLEKQGCLPSFLSGVEDTIAYAVAEGRFSSGMTVDFFLEVTCDNAIRDAVTCAFRWSATPEGHEFWADISAEWKHHLKKLGVPGGLA